MAQQPSDAGSLADVFEYVEAQRQRSIDRLLEYVRMPSISAHGVGIGEVAEHIAGILRRSGLDTEIVPTAGWPMVLAISAEVPGTPTVLLYGHYDVQPPEPLEGWE